MKKWKNWSGNVKARPKHYYSPESEEEISEIIQSAKSLRTLGTGHSFTPICKTDETLIDINSMSGIINNNANLFEYWAGTVISEVGRQAHLKGYAIPVQGDVDSQTLAGAFSTATHSSNGSHPCMAFCAKNMTLLDHKGDKQVFEKGTEAYDAMMVGLGMFGVATRYTLEMEKSELLYRQQFVIPLEQILNEFDDYLSLYNTYEFVHFPWTSEAYVTVSKKWDTSIKGAKRANKSTAEYLGKKEAQVMRVAGKISKYLPFLTPKINRYMSSQMNPSQLYGHPHIINANYREAKFNEMEFAIPVEHGIQCLREILSLMKRNRLYTAWPIQIRFIKSDDFWLSPFYKQDSISIAIHLYHTCNYHKIFKACESVFMKYYGRPHWGKIHYLTRQQVKKRYRKFSDFVELRRELDPDDKFLNPYLKNYFG